MKDGDDDDDESERRERETETMKEREGGREKTEKRGREEESPPWRLGFGRFDLGQNLTRSPVSSCRAFCGRRLSLSAAGAKGLSEAVAQGDWFRALWSEVVLGLSLREWREQENVPSLISVTDSKGNYDHSHNETIGPSEDRISASELAIIRQVLRKPRMFLRWVERLRCQML